MVSIEAVWDQDAHDNNILVLEKAEGKINLGEAEDLLRNSKTEVFRGIM